MAEERNKPSHEKKDSSKSVARQAEWESVAVIFLFPIFFFAALMDDSFE